MFAGLCAISPLVYDEICLGYMVFWLECVEGEVNQASEKKVQVSFSALGGGSGFARTLYFWTVLVSLYNMGICSDPHPDSKSICEEVVGWDKSRRMEYEQVYALLGHDPGVSCIYVSALVLISLCTYLN